MPFVGLIHYTSLTPVSDPPRTDLRLRLRWDSFCPFTPTKRRLPPDCTLRPGLPTHTPLPSPKTPPDTVYYTTRAHQARPIDCDGYRQAVALDVYGWWSPHMLL